MAAVAMTAAVLVWAVLFVDVLLARGDTGTALARPSGNDGARSEQAPAPVTTRSS